MEQPSPAIPATTAPPQPLHPNHYPDSIESSPRSRTADAWEEPQPPTRLRLMCSYGGHIVPRPHDKSLCYVGGETRIVVADRNSSLSDLSAKLSKTLLAGKSFALKYQLPSEDLDSLISVTTDEDLDNMIDEYDRTRPNRLRLFLFSTAAKTTESASSKSNDDNDDWFVAALNGGGGGSGSGANNNSNNNNNKGSSASVNCLLGLDDDSFIGDGSNHSATAAVETTAAIQQQKKAQESQSVSVPDSPMLDTTSSFGSTSSSPSLANLPPIRVHVVDGGFQDQKTVPIEDHFSQMNIAAAVRQDESVAVTSGFLVMSSPPSSALNSIAVSSSLAAPPSSAGIGIEYTATNRDLISDDERSDHGGGIPIGYRKQQFSQKQTATTGVVVMDLPSPDSVSSDSSFGNPNAITRSKGLAYDQNPIMTRINQPPIVVDPPKLSNDNNISDYVLQQQFELPQPQHLVRHHHPGGGGGGGGGAHYVHHHHPAAYYHPVYTSQPPPQQQQQQQYPVYYLPARQPYNNLSVQPATTVAAPPSLVHVTSSGQQYFGGGGGGGYTQIHPSSTMQYEYGEQGRGQIYYTQPLGAPPPPPPPQYQTMTADAINQQQQQMRTSQQL